MITASIQTYKSTLSTFIFLTFYVCSYVKYIIRQRGTRLVPALHAADLESIPGPHMVPKAPQCRARNAFHTLPGGFPKPANT